MDTGKMTQQGFAPAEPTLEALLERVGIGKGWDGLNADPAGRDVEEAQVNAAHDLKRMYAQLFATPAGQKVLDDIAEQTLRRCCSHPDQNAGIEQEALYGRQRKGQNGIAVYILKMIHDGRKLPAPGSKKKKKN